MLCIMEGGKPKRLTTSRAVLSPQRIQTLFPFRLKRASNASALDLVIRTLHDLFPPRLFFTQTWNKLFAQKRQKRQSIYFHRFPPIYWTLYFKEAGFYD
ncbi:hypothetical protein NPIL_38181 [Nephila pilipes]|uniref:Uncharacterized protein n=1 Tax=Nephila pilipes TaxID=299642 RepID=A0A8X6QT55_NEPPI|nr:hypothetical protein NPIL_38181 [Nephila pilipes]